MYSREEIKKIRVEFWDGFQKYSAPKRRKKGKPKNWILQNTGIKALDLKFHIDNKLASVGIDIVSKSLDHKLAYWNKLLGVKNLLDSKFGNKLIWDDMYQLESGKDIIRIAIIKEDVSILNKDCWEKVYEFFYMNMLKFENFLEEYKDIIRVRQGEV